MEACICIISWDGVRSRMISGYSLNITASFEALSEANWQRLLVRKIIAVLSGLETMDELVSPFHGQQCRAD